MLLDSINLQRLLNKLSNFRYIMTKGDGDFWLGISSETLKYKTNLKSKAPSVPLSISWGGKTHTWIVKDAKVFLQP
jgi:hypothetical protein